MITAEIQLRFLFDVFSGSTPKTGKGFYWNGNISWITPEDVSVLKEELLLSDTKRKITEEGFSNSGLKMAQKDAIVFTKRAPIGNLAILNIGACCNQGCFLLKPKGEVNSVFFYYYLLSKKASLQSLGRGSTFMELSLDEMKSLKVPYKSMEHQNKVVNYLNHEIKGIDNLIKLKERQIASLSEKRQSLIAQVVTKGLDPNVKLKNSGIDWLGEVPKHWEVKRLGVFGRFSKGGGFSKNDLTEDGCVAIIYGDIYTRYNIEITTPSRYIDQDTANNAVVISKGDLLFTGSGETMEEIGKCVVYQCDDMAYAGGDVIIFQQGSYNSLFLSYVLNTGAVNIEKAKLSKGGIIVHIYSSQLKNIAVALPPIEEQKTIVTYLQNEIDRIELLKTKTTHSIQLLKERKVALVAAAVTGQIEIPEV